MARANFIKSANKPIYRNGKQITKVHESGKDKGQQYNIVDKHQPADESDTILINVGESYYWWKFRYGSKIFSKFAPKPSQLTQNPFYSTLYDIQDEIDCLSPDDSIVDNLETIKSSIEELRDEQQEKMDNMPESLQGNCDSYNILEERHDALDEWYSELDSIDVEVDESLSEDEQQERYDEILEEIQGTSCGV